jgi:uncharacterized protein YdeI (YjbR/CyaY-like superfamily)
MSEDTLYIPNREEWRKWLEMNHDSKALVWLIYYKKHTGKPSIRYDYAVEEALCFGWIDSLVRRIDEERYMQKYTPRKPKSTWSKHNVKRVEKMIELGKMAPEGMKLYQYAIDNCLLPEPEEKTGGEVLFPEVPDYFTKALAANPEAGETFNSLAPSYKLQYLGWIMEAKKEETRKKRLNEAIELLKTGNTLGMK